MALYIFELRGYNAEDGGTVQLLVDGTVENQPGPACTSLRQPLPGDA